MLTAMFLAAAVHSMVNSQEGILYILIMPCYLKKAVPEQKYKACLHLGW